ncbi:MAG: phenylalanine--tRNA ligase subunit alpha [Bdellovibrionales bacterium]|nr:phenylalanine--tRNA ligase subunit alpha [Bdellovibrionales bacterium]
MNDIQSQIISRGQTTLADISKTNTLSDLEQIRVSVLGKKGTLSEALKTLGTVPAEERPKIGALANEWKAKIEGALETKKSELEAKEIEASLGKTKIDVSLPGRRPHMGALHPITQTIKKVSEVLGRIGFDVTVGPEAETDFLNFEAANIPKDHPARDMQDTFFLGPGVVLRSHTTAVQMRAMRGKTWPIRILCPGAVYRADNDATHSPMFHQIEGLWVDKKVSMSDLKGVLGFFAKELFGADAKIRLRPSYFAFVEPGAEVDVSCAICAGRNPKCSVCKGTGWLEILGAGMVHPRLFEYAGYKSDEISGFAFGMGVERIAMLLHDIPDLRLMFQGDQRFLKQLR